jgi:hypothetical protein
MAGQLEYTVEVFALSPIQFAVAAFLGAIRSVFMWPAEVSGRLPRVDPIRSEVCYESEHF